MSDSEDDFAPSKPPPDSDDDFAPSKQPETQPKPKLKGEEKKAQETKEFDEICEQGMAHVEEEEWKDATLCFERALKLDAKTEGSKEVSEERADCAFNLACCHAQCDRLDDAETWLRRAVAWGVREVDLMKDKHLAPLRAHDVALCMNLSEALRPAPVRQAAVLQRSRRQRSGGAMAALIRQEKERQAQQEDDDIDDFWKDEKDDDEYSGSAESEHERRDVFDSDFDEDESESEEEGWGFDDDQKEAKAREKRIEDRKREKEKERVEREKAQPVSGKRRRRAAAENAEERTRQELEGDTTKDDSDDDFKDAAADKELSEGKLGVREQAAPSYRDAVSAAKREKLVAKAAADLGFDSDDDVEMAPAKKKKKVKKSPESKKVCMRCLCQGFTSCRWPRDDGVDAAARRRRRESQGRPTQDKKKKKPKKRDVLAGIFGSKGAAAIVRRADRSIEERKHAPPPKSKDEILKNLVRKQKVVEERRFGAISASRGAAAPSRHRRDSCPSDEVVGGLFLDFEAIRTEASDRDAPRRRRDRASDQDEVGN